MATAATAAVAGDTSDDSSIHIKIKSPSPEVPADLELSVDSASTVNDLKALIRGLVESKPVAENQRLIYRGKVLEGNAILGTTLIGNEREEQYTLHLVVRPTQPGSSSTSASGRPPNATSPNNPFREGPRSRRGFNLFDINHSAESSPVSTTTTTSSIRRGPTTVMTTTRIATITRPAAVGSFFGTPANPPAAAPAGEGAGVPDSTPSGDTSATSNALLEQLSAQLGQELRGLGRGNENAGTSTGVSFPDLQSRRNAATPGPARERVLRMRLGPDGLHMPPPDRPNDDNQGQDAGDPPPRPLERNPVSEILGTLANLGPEPDNFLNRTQRRLESLRAESAVRMGASLASNVAARRRALEESLRELEEEERLTESSRFPPLTLPYTFHPIPQQSAPTITPGSQVLLLQDSLGRPHSLLVGPPGSAYQGAFPAPVPNIGSFNTYPDIPAYLGGPVPTVSPATLLEQTATLQRELLEQLGNAAPFNLDPNNNNPNNFGNLNNANNANNARVNEVNFPRMAQQLREQASHLWLLMKLIVFVVLFTGNGGWRRMIYLSAISAVIFVWQTGFGLALVRPIIDFLMPLPPPIQAQRNQQEHQPNDQPTPPAQPNQQQPEPNPAQIAQMHIDRHEDGMRRMFRTLERSVGLFVASLIPGLHERHVNAVEQQQRLLREQQRQIEEQQREREREDQGQAEPPLEPLLGPQPETGAAEVPAEPLL